MKILLTGCKGQLGLALQRQFQTTDARYNLCATDLAELDITDYNQVSAKIRQFRPQVVINAAAKTDVDACETAEREAFRINAVGAQYLAAAAYDVGAKIVQISTDYVFDGSGNRPLREYDPVNPLSVYGRSKAWGEQLVRHVNPRHFILRTAWLYGEGNNFVRTMLRLAEEHRELSVVSDQIGSPTHAADLARCIVNLMVTDCYGTYHTAGQGACSRFDLACKIFKLTKRQVTLLPVASDAAGRIAVRPKYAALENFRLELMGLNTFPRWEDALAEYLASSNYRV